MNKTALITGASGGIGLELAKIHASKGDHLVLIARSKDKLDAIKKELEATYQVKVYTIAKDLGLDAAAQEVYDETQGQKIKIDYLINNAGFGDYGMFCETDWNKEAQMIRLNIATLTHFTKLYAKEMVRQGAGKIMNVASTAAFQPGPGMAVYFATKAYVLHFSEAINYELREKGERTKTAKFQRRGRIRIQSHDERKGCSHTWTIKLYTGKFSSFYAESFGGFYYRENPTESYLIHLDFIVSTDGEVGI